MQRTFKVLIGLLAVAVLAVGCTGDDEGAVTTTWAASETTSAATTTMAFDAGEMPATGGEDGGLFGAQTPGNSDTDAQAIIAVLQTDRLIVYTANLVVEVDDVIAAGEQALAAVAGLGGALYGQETTTGPEARSVLTIKVPPENFSEALGRLAGIGRLVSQSVFTDDVTERVVDLESRITTSEASVVRLRALLAAATDMEDIASLERELLQRETDLEVMRGQLRTVEDQVALATIVLALTEPSPDPAVELLGTAYFGHDGGAGCPGSVELAIDEGEPFTACYEIKNTGNAPLGDVEVYDSGLDVRPEDLILLDGDLSVPLPPGGHLLLAFEAEADPDRWTDPWVQATALDENGNPLWQTEVTNLEPAELQVAEDDSLPGFVDVLLGAWHALQKLGGIIVVVGAAVLPFLWIPVLLAVAWWWLRRRRPVTAGGPTPEPPAPPIDEPTDT
ncbi:MAG TPA: DUF4349 domain-containing protein [Acidimicrobiia bacterium]|nr:DUF4349 domain-containing protein [Acidimicrobiia bacterium]